MEIGCIFATVVGIREVLLQQKKRKQIAAYLIHSSLEKATEQRNWAVGWLGAAKVTKANSSLAKHSVFISATGAVFVITVFYFFSIYKGSCYLLNKMAVCRHFFKKTRIKAFLNFSVSKRKT